MTSRILPTTDSEGDLVPINKTRAWLRAIVSFSFIFGSRTWPRIKTVLPFMLLAGSILLWFKPDHVIYFSDETFPFNPRQDLTNAVYSWSLTPGFGSPSLAITFLPYFLAMAVLSSVLPLWAAQAVLWYAVYASSGIGMYFLSQRFLCDLPYRQWGARFAAGTYMLSSYWVFGGLQDPPTAIVIFAFLPAFILVIDKLLDDAMLRGIRPGLFHLAILALAFACLPAFTSPMFPALILVLGAYSIYSILSKSPTTRIRLQLLGSLLVGLLLCVGSLSFWWIPAIQSLGSSISPTTALGKALFYWLGLNSHGYFLAIANYPLGPNSSYAPVFGWTWVPTLTRPPLYPFDILAVPILALSAFLFQEFFRNTMRRFVAMMAIAGIFLSGGLSAPGGTLYAWLFNNVPFWSAFDNPYLWFSPVLTLCYSLLLGFTLASLIARSESYSTSHKHRVLSKLIPETFVNGSGKILQWRATRRPPTMHAALSVTILVAVASLVLLPSVPLISGQGVPHGSPSALVEIPPSTYALVSYINSLPGSFSVLSLPVFLGDSQANWSSGGYFGSNPLPSLVRQPFVGSTYGLPTSEISSIGSVNHAIWSGNHSLILTYLQALGFKYVLVNADYSTNPGEILTPFSIQRTNQALNSTTGVTYLATYGFTNIYSVVTPRSSVSLVDAFGNVATLTEPISSTSPLSFPAILKNWSGTSQFRRPDWASNQFGDAYSNVSVLPNGSTVVYFNYSANHTWPFLDVIDQAPININTSTYDYIVLSYQATPGTSISVFSGNTSSPATPLALVATSEAGGTIDAAYSLGSIRPAALAFAMEFAFANPNVTSGVWHILDIQAASGITLKGVDWSYSDFGPEYAFLGYPGPTSMQLLFNYSQANTWSFLEAVTTSPLSINTDLNQYLGVNYSASYGVSLQIQVWNDSGGAWFLPLSASEVTGNASQAFYSLAQVGGNVSKIVLMLDLNLPSTTRGSLLIRAIQPFVAISADDFLTALPALNLTPDSIALTSDLALTSEHLGRESDFRFAETNPTSWTVSFQVTSPGVVGLVLLQTFDAGWAASAETGYVFDLQHLLVNGFMNGWTFNATPGFYSIDLNFNPQMRLVYTAIASGGIAAATVMFVAATSALNRRRSRV